MLITRIRTHAYTHTNIPTHAYMLITRISPHACMHTSISGTDPREGAALAQAVLEQLVTVSPSQRPHGTRVRLAVSTHYPHVRQFAAVDPRFLIAAMASQVCS